MLTAVVIVTLSAPCQYCPEARPLPAGLGRTYGGCYGGAYAPAPPPRPRFGRPLDLTFEDGASRLQLRLGAAEDSGAGYGAPPGIREGRGGEAEGELEYLGPAPAQRPDDFVGARSRAAVCAERRRTFASTYRAGYYPGYFRP